MQTFFFITSCSVCWCHDICWSVMGLRSSVVSGMKGLREHVQHIWHQSSFVFCCSAFMLSGQMFWPFSPHHMVSSPHASPRPPPPFPILPPARQSTSSMTFYSTRETRVGVQLEALPLSPLSSSSYFSPSLQPCRRCQCHYPPAEHSCPCGRAWPYSDYLSLLSVCLHSVASTQWATFINLHLHEMFNMMEKWPCQSKLKCAVIRLWVQSCGELWWHNIFTVNSLWMHNQHLLFIWTE